MNYLIVTKSKGIYFGVFDKTFHERHIVFMRLKNVFKIFSSWKGNWLTTDYSSMVIKKRDIAWKLEISSWDDLSKEDIVKTVSRIYPDLKDLRRDSELVREAIFNGSM